MSIGKRFIKLVRSNLNSLLDRTAESYGDDYAGGGGDSSRRLEELSDAELEAELQRRRRRREGARRAAAEAASSGRAPRERAGSFEQQAWEEVEEAVRRGSGSGRYRSSGERPPRGTRGHDGRPRRRTGGRDVRLARLYAQLECPYGSDLNTVRQHYRTMMRKYHPDMHSGDADKQRLATELSQRLTEAYNELRRSLSAG